MTEADAVRHLLLYGSLRRGLPSHAQLQLPRRLRFLRRVRLKGRMYDLGAWPGVAPGVPGQVIAELFGIADDAVLEALDRFEGPRFERRIVEADGVRAFIYAFVGDPGSAPVVRSGDWPAYASKSRPRPV